MRITRDMEIAGMPAIEIRDALKWLQAGDGFSARSLARCMSIKEKVAANVFASLLELGYIKPSEELKDHYVLTIKGGQLANAHATRPIKRTTAEKLLREAVQRAESINRNPDRIYLVSRIGVFGSYLSDAETLGDLDLAIELTRRPSAGSFPYADLAYADQAESNGRCFKGFFYRCGWAHEETLRDIKNSSSYISIHLPDDLILTQVPVKTLYEFKP